MSSLRHWARSASSSSGASLCARLRSDWPTTRVSRSPDGRWFAPVDAVPSTTPSVRLTRSRQPVTTGQKHPVPACSHWAHSTSWSAGRRSWTRSSVISSGCLTGGKFSPRRTTSDRRSPGPPAQLTISREQGTKENWNHGTNQVRSHHRQGPTVVPKAVHARGQRPRPAQVLVRDPDSEVGHRDLREASQGRGSGRG